jgi:molybdopterin molybdotransferase
MAEQNMRNREMLEMEEALAVILEHVDRLDPVEVPLDRAAGLVLAEDVVCREGHPPFSRSAMDGYAVRAADIEKPGASLKLVETVAAGSRPSAAIEPGTCVRIMTGAPVPRGADTVVMQEDTQGPDESGRVLFQKPAPVGSHIRYAGEDLRPGETAAAAGKILAPPALGTCALVGAARVRAFRRPRVSVLATGDEVVEPDEAEPAFGFIRNANGPMLTALLRGVGAEARYLGIVPDDPERLEAAFRQGLESDLMIVTGGVSVGQFDYVGRVLGDMGLEVLFRKVRTKPGKPVNFACGAGRRVLGLPGNPVSVLMSFHVYAAPALRKMMGRAETGAAFEGRLTQALESDRERTLFAPVRWEFREGCFRLTPCRLNGSADLAGASRANGFALLPVKAGAYEPGETVRFIVTEHAG